MYLFGKPKESYIKSCWFSSQNNFTLKSVEHLEGKAEENSAYRYSYE